ncbi:hypothetical protein FOA43_003149 [Brettanomyces nanus]|uniref:RNA polymerase II subunit B1 CTD phosphatase RPAP2 homolog n=1 Tax=Eeniella nana TaxID=13502 RepID=A0A875S4A7_EENNA|nr:uncharacterized protein FOA43_003149 [Brettanomyces nanus]QPG75788.1 hypothetical protein FOA43_003149 [Brettanomyces nanus]
MTSLLERTSIGPNTYTFRSLEQLLKPYEGKSLLTPREANTLNFHIVENLMVENCDRDTLKILARYLSKKGLDDLVEERVTNHYCGYPLCRFHDPKQIKEMQINKLVAKLKMPRYYLSKFCCKRHYQATEFYKKQLSADVLFMRTNINQPFFQSDTYENSIVLLEEYFEAKKNKGSINLNTPAMNELMELMEKMQIEDDEGDDGVKGANETNGTNGAHEVADMDKSMSDISIVEKEGPQESSRNYAGSVGYQ